jgi:hypothetical protein
VFKGSYSASATQRGCGCGKSQAATGEAQGSGQASGAAQPDVYYDPNIFKGSYSASAAQSGQAAPIQPSWQSQAYGQASQSASVDPLNTLATILLLQLLLGNSGCTPEALAEVAKAVAEPKKDCGCKNAAPRQEPKKKGCNC